MITSTALTTRRMLVTVESSSPWNFILRTLVWKFHTLNHGGSNFFHAISLLVLCLIVVTMTIEAIMNIKKGINVNDS